MDDPTPNIPPENLRESSSSFTSETAKVVHAHPKVSVVVPTFNRPPMLRRAISSLLAQTWKEFEIIVVDDASPEPMQGVIDSLQAVDISLLIHKQRRGAAAARNTGIRAAKGEFIAFLDDDDQWLPTKLEVQINKFKDAAPETGLVYCGHVVISDLTGNVVATRIPAAPPIGYVELLRSTVFPTSVPLIRKSCFDKVGLFDETLPGTQDRDMWLRLARRFRFDFVPDVLVQNHIHGHQITTNLSAKIEAKEMMLTKYYVDLRNQPSILATQLFRLGMLYFADGRPAQGRRCLIKSLRYQPVKKEIYRHICLSCLAPKRHQRLVNNTAFSQVDGLALYW